MGDKLVDSLVKARADLRAKLRALKADIAESQRKIDIQYAPISKPLQEIAMKLDPTGVSRKTHSKDITRDVDISEAWSDIIPEKALEAVPGTSIIRHVETPSKKRVGWFSPATHSSPTKRKFEDPALSPLTTKPKTAPSSGPKSRMSVSYVQPTKTQSKPRLSTSFTQPLFIEDEYIGEPLPETPKVGEKGERIEEYEEDETGTSGSFDLEKSMAHAVSLLKSKPTKSIISNKSLNKTLLETEEVKESLKEYNPTIRPYVIGLMTDEHEEFDEKYGIREVDGNLKIGNADVRFDGPNIIIGRFSYKATKGLLELLFKKKPSKFLYGDAQNYKYILNDTHSARVNYDPDQKLAASKAHKYNVIIKPILKGKRPEVWWTRTWKTGLGLLKNVPSFLRRTSLRKTVIPNSKIEYKYWDNVNEICRRLKLLVASKEAGHTGHENEIIAIIEELKESKIIK